MDSDDLTLLAVACNDHGIVKTASSTAHHDNPVSLDVVTPPNHDHVPPAVAVAAPPPIYFPAAPRSYAPSNAASIKETVFHQLWKQFCQTNIPNNDFHLHLNPAPPPMNIANYMVLMPTNLLSTFDQFASSNKSFVVPSSIDTLPDKAPPTNYLFGDDTNYDALPNYSRNMTADQEKAWISSLTLNDVVLVGDGFAPIDLLGNGLTDLESIGGVFSKDLTVKQLIGFIKLHGIKRYKGKPKAMLCQLIVQKKCFVDQYNMKPAARTTPAAGPTASVPGAPCSSSSIAPAPLPPNAAVAKTTTTTTAAATTTTTTPAKEEPF